MLSENIVVNYVNYFSALLISVANTSCYTRTAYKIKIHVLVCFFICSYSVSNLHRVVDNNIKTSL